jgi:threonine dehydrogenase-like Zn-dependent dehydrogenase
MSSVIAAIPLVNTMVASVIVEPGRVELESIPLPAPAPNEVRVKLEGCGVCASNIPPWEGREWFKYPMAPGALGHEGWGTVDAVGRDVKSIKEGDRVSMLSDHAYAQYDIAAEDRVVPVPRDFANDPFPGEPLGCAMNIFRRCGIEPGMNVAIIGIGFLGALLTRMAHLADANVIAISRRPFSLQIAKNMGADHLITMDDHWKIIEQVKNLTNNKLCDVVIEAVGKQWPLDLAAEITAERGRLVVAGYHQDGPRQCNMQMWNWKGIDVINAHERDPKIYVQGIRDAAAAIASGRIDPSPLYTHRFDLSQLPEALNMTRNRPDGFVKALVMMDQA